jgi:hypothetical protein
MDQAQNHCAIQSKRRLKVTQHKSKVDDAVDALSPLEAQEIQLLYIDQHESMATVARKTGIRLEVVSRYLNRNGFKRTMSQNSKSSPWRGIQNASYIEAEAKSKAADKGGGA